VIPAHVIPVLIKWFGRRRRVPAVARCGELVVADRAELVEIRSCRYSITHEPTGCTVWPYPIGNRALAVRFMRELHEQLGDGWVVAHPWARAWRKTRILEIAADVGVSRTC
jgi:hypothetical protein